MLFGWIPQADVTASAISCISLDLEQARKREGRLKEKVQELTKKLEKLREYEKSSEMRHQQSVGFVSELKKANRYTDGIFVYGDICSSFAFSAMTLLVGWQEEHPA